MCHSPVTVETITHSDERININATPSDQSERRLDQTVLCRMNVHKLSRDIHLKLK